MHHAYASSKIVLIKLVEIWQIEDTRSTEHQNDNTNKYTVEPTLYIHQPAIFCCSGAFCVQNAPVELKLSLYLNIQSKCTYILHVIKTTRVVRLDYIISFPST